MNVANSCRIRILVTTHMRKPAKQKVSRYRGRSVVRKGYGMAVLTILIASLVIIGTSMQMMSSPLGYMGDASRNSMAARGIALIGIRAFIFRE